MHKIKPHNPGHGLGPPLNSLPASFATPASSRVHRSELSRERVSGFSLLEMLASLFIIMLVLAGSYLYYIENRKVARSQIQVAEARQNARIALGMLSRELLMAGYGLTKDGLQVDAIIPNEPSDPDTFTDHTITLRANFQNTASVLASDMLDAADPLQVPDASGFSVGQRLLVYDTTGSYDFFTVTGIVEGAPDQIQHSGALSKPYLVSAGTQVTASSEIVYRFDAGEEKIYRQMDGGTEHLLAENVVSLLFTYYDDSLPPIAFQPATRQDRNRIRQVKIQIQSRTAQRELDTGDYRKTTMERKVTPRNMGLES